MCLYLQDLLLIIKKKGLVHQISGQNGSKVFFYHNNFLLKNSLLLIIETKMFTVQLFIFTVLFLSCMLRN